MIKKIFYTLLLIFALALCASFSLVNDVKKLELGMTKKEVISILGKSYTLVDISQTPEGSLDILRYASVPNDYYLVHSLDGKLVEWHEDVYYKHRTSQGDAG